MSSASLHTTNTSARARRTMVRRSKEVLAKRHGWAGVLVMPRMRCPSPDHNRVGPCWVIYFHEARAATATGAMQEVAERDG